VGSSKVVQPKVEKLSENVRLRDPWAAGEWRSGGELLKESGFLMCADFGHVRDVRRSLLSYNPHVSYITEESSILSHMSSSWSGSVFGG
jgi:hypothetical protein